MKRNGLYPRVQADTHGPGVVSQSGGVVLVETVRVSGVNKALRPRRYRAGAIRDPAKVVIDLAVALAPAETRDQPMPAGSTPTKPHKTVTVATRLTTEHVAEIEGLADRLDVPVSALIRGWILGGLTGRKEDSVVSGLDRLSADVQRLRELVA